MEVSSSHQMYVFMLCLAAGGAFGVLFDLQRSLRRLNGAGGVRTTLEDVLFVLVCTGAAIALGFYFNSGQMRYYQVMGLISGALFYAAFLSRLTMRILAGLYAFLQKYIVRPLVKMIKIIIGPCVRLLLFLKRRFIKTKVFFRKILKAFRNKKKQLKKRMKML